MGTCYTYILYDDFDWDYRDKPKQQIIEDLKVELPIAEILATWPHYIVVDMDKTWPLGDRAAKLSKYCDVAYCYPDSDQSNIQRVHFKETEEDKKIKELRPENRNAKFIKQANEEWNARYATGR